jgi:tRNA(Ile)-lysidine synthase
MPGPAVSTVRRAVKLWIGQGRLGLACSGGADSMVLADAVIAVAGAANVVVLHIDHALSSGSASVAEGVRAWAEGQGVTAMVRRVTVDDDGSIEAAAREARYDAFQALRDELGLATIWLAHTARDQAETVMMRVLRGTGPAGLAAMAPKRDCYVRPLLEISRDVIDAYVVERGLPTWADPMNEDPTFTRVRLRKQILPALREENPSLDEALCRLAASTREWLEAIDAIATPFATLPIACSALAEQPSAVRKRAYAIALDRVGVGYDAVHLDAIDDLVLAPAAGERAIDLPRGQLVRSYDALDLRHSSELPRDDLSPPAGPYELRVWQPGDRMKPARLKGRSRKLSDLFIDLKVSREVRRTARVVIRTSDGVIVWAEHIGLAFEEPETSAPIRMTRSFSGH